MLENSEEKQKKTPPHIYFQVANFIYDENFVEAYGLLPIDRLLLGLLAKFNGSKGIIPSTDTLARKLNITPTYAKDRINHLDKIGVLRVIRKFGVNHQYSFPFLSTDRSTTVDPSTPVDRSTTVAEPVNYSFRNRSTAVDTISFNDQYIKRERDNHSLSLVNNFTKRIAEQGRGVKVMDEEKRANPPLSNAETANAYSRHHRGFSGNVPIVTTRDISEDDPNQFYPSEENKILCQNLKLNLEEELQSFRDRHKYKFTQAEFSKWIKNSAKYISKNSKQNQTPKESRAVVPDWGPGHPSYDSLHKR